MRGMWGLRASLAFALAVGTAASARGLEPVSKTTLVRVQREAPQRASQVANQLRATRAQLRLSAKDDFSILRTTTDKFGETHVRVQQTYQGIPVWGGAAAVHLDANGKTLEMSDSLLRGVSVSTAHRMNADQAVAKARLSLAVKGDWSVPPTSELVVYPVRKALLPPGKDAKHVNAVEMRHVTVAWKLAYHVHTELSNRQDGIKQTDFLIDANTGETLRRWSSLETVSGTGNSEYSGTVTLETSDDGAGGYLLVDPTRGTGAPHPVTGDVGITIRNSDYTGNYGSIYADPDNTWGDGANFNFDPLNPPDTNSDTGQTAGVDALYGLEKTWDYYRDIHSRNGIDDQGTAPVGVVHYPDSLTGGGYDNASWSDSCFCMVFGDGSGVANGGFNVLTELDVVGHELSHGVTSRTADLTYDGESGGLNEASSDINGAMVEAYTLGNGDLDANANNWLIGEQLAPVPLRYMYKPSLDGLSYDAWAPDIGNVDVHYSSGPMNRAFYFLSQGASSDSASDSYSSYLPGGMSGIGNSKAAAIWYRALTQYLLPWSDYVSARVAALHAAKDYFGTLSPEYAAVENAFAAINVGYSAGAFDDLYPPTVAVSASEANGMWTITADAVDNVGISGVDFYLDGVYLETVFKAPFELNLPAFEYANGPHDVAVFATDFANNYASDEQTVTLSTGADNPLVNGGFEAGEAGWTVVDSYGYGSPILDDGGFGLGHGGTWFAWLNDYGEPGTDSVSQTVTIPTDSEVTLGFWLSVDTTETDGLQHGTFTVTVDDGTGAVQVGPTIDNLTDTGGFASYAHYQFDMLPYAGKTVTITFKGTEDGVTGEYTGFLLDDVSIRGFMSADTTPPMVSASEAGTTGPLTFSASIADRSDISSVTFLVDGAPVGAPLTSAPWIMSVDSSSLTNGPHVLTVTATDAASNTATSDAVPFSVDNTLQQVLVNPSFETGATDMDGNWIPDGWNVGTDNPYGWLPAYNDGRYAHSGVAYVWMGGWDENVPVTDTLSQTFTLPAGTESAYLRFYCGGFTSETDGQVHDSLHIQIRDAAGTTVLQELAVKTNLDADGYWHQLGFDLTAYSGQTVTLYFEMDSDAATGTSYLIDQFELDASQADAPPVVGASVTGNGGGILLGATLSDDGAISSVRFLIDGNEVQSVSNPSARVGISYDSTLLADGVHTLLVEATDNAGKVGTSAPVDFTINNWMAGDQTPPSMDLLWSEHACAQADLRITTSDDFVVEEVELYADGQYLGTFQMPPPTLPLTVSTASFGEGPHTLTANAIDGRGHHVVASVDFVQHDLLINPDWSLVLAGTSQAYSGQSCSLQPSTVGWSVQESGGGSIDAAGVYLAPMAQGTYHVVATADADGSQNTATVRVYNPDVDTDGATDGVDMGALVAAYGSQTGDANYSAAADLDGNGQVDDADLNLFLPQFGK